MPPTPRRRLGDTGEAIARQQLESLGMQFLDQNWHCLAGEIDLVMQDKSELVFVEVKTRRGDGAGRAEESISPSKAKKLLAAGSWYLQAHPGLGDPIWRIDLLAITLDKKGVPVRVTHIENAVVSG